MYHNHDKTYPVGQHGTSSEIITGTDSTKIVNAVTNTQHYLSMCRNTFGKFPGVIPPSLNIFCGDQTSDAAPVGTFTRPTANNRLGQGGLLESVAAGSVRREWGPDGSLYGWKIEETRTNLLTYSSDCSNALWTFTNMASVATDGTLAPDGAGLAYRLTESTAESVQRTIRRTSVTVPSGTSFVCSVFIKPDSNRTGITLYLYYSGNYYLIDFNLSTLTWSGSAFGSATGTGGIISLPNGWYRLWVSLTLTSAATSVNMSGYFSNDPTKGNASYTGDGTSGIYLWGAQIESGSYPTSYIPTTTATVVRSADVWTYPVSTSWFNPLAGTFFVAGRTAGGAPSAQQFYAQIDDGGTSNRMHIYRSSSNIATCLITASGSVTAGVAAVATLDNSTVFKLAFSWSSSFFGLSLNGATAVTATPTGFPSGLTTIRIGSNAAGAVQMGGHLSHLAYFPQALTSGQLQAITL